MIFLQTPMPSPLNMDILFECLRYGTMLYNFLARFYTPPTPVRRYFLSDDDEYDISYTRVPEGAVYIEEWVKEDKRLCYVQYEGEELDPDGHADPFTLAVNPARCPWVWVGDKETEIDLTKTFNKFLIPNNVIRLDLVQKLIHITEYTNLVYIDAKTFEVRKFPGDGILIEEDE